MLMFDHAKISTVGIFWFLILWVPNIPLSIIIKS